ncbi:MAG: hypothetical protein AAB490_02310 [Patescibacteria group bacterium]
MKKFSVEKGNAPYAVAVLLSGCWIYLTRHQYAYTQFPLTLAGSKLFPFVAWSVSLILLFSLYRSIERHLQRPFLITVLCYWILLILLEAVAYNVLGIRNAGTEAYRGLPLCECLHAPLWMQAGYFLMGPLYLLCVDAMRRLTSRHSAQSTTPSANI